MSEFTQLLEGWTLKPDDTSAQKLTLTRADGVSLAIDFASGKARHRAHESGKGAQALSKALGIKNYVNAHGHYPHIIDATGGLGQDAWAIASTGCTVTIIERHPVVHALLDDALKRAMKEPEISALAQRITLIQGDASELLGTANSTEAHAKALTDAHAIYLDPMYPERRKKASSKKGMQFLQELLGHDNQNEEALLHNALQVKAVRVAVKRPKGAPVLAGSDAFTGQLTTVVTPNTRYDVYHGG